jgi:hypothetical protein
MVHFWQASQEHLMVLILVPSRSSSNPSTAENKDILMILQHELLIELEKICSLELI